MKPGSMRLRNLPNFARLITAVSCFSVLSTAAAHSEPSSPSDSKALDSYRYKEEGKVRSAWVSPPVLQQDDESCDCYFRIMKDGHIAKLEFKNKYDNILNYTIPRIFGGPSLDKKQRDKDPFTNSCLAALRKTAFDPPPLSIGELSVCGKFSNDSGNLHVDLDAVRGSVNLHPYDFEIDPNDFLQVAFVRSGDRLVRSSVDLYLIDLAPYVDSVNKKIGQAWTPCGDSLGPMFCFLTLDPSGTVKSIELMSSPPECKDPEKLSESFLAAIKKAEPFEKTPTGIGLVVLLGRIGERDGKPVIDFHAVLTQPHSGPFFPGEFPSTFK
jgi:hypothetical protein